MFNYPSFVKGLFVFTIVNCQLLIVNCAQAQTDFRQQYTLSKKLFTDGKYNLAMESFKKLVPHDQANPYSEYASFYYALSAYHQGYSAVSKDMFNQIKSRYPNWDKIDEVNIWLAKIHFDNKDYFQGMRMLESVKNAKARKEITPMKKKAITSIQDVETLKMLRENYPADIVIGETLAHAVSRSLTTAGDKKLLDSLIAEYGLKKTDFINEIPETIHKEIYSVSILFPFVVNTLDPTTTRKKNQFVLDLYEGMKLATDTLEAQGIKISLRAYDTERNPEKIKKILETNELKNTDIIVGPLFQEENKVVREFSNVNQINLFNPISNNTDLIRGNFYGFLFQPATETLGDHAAQFLVNRDSTQKCIVFYGESKRDSTLAVSFVKRASESGMRILKSERISKDRSSRIIDILAKPTEFDEFKYPIQFTLPKDSLDCIFVASDDPLIYTKVISSVEARADSVLIIGSDNWLDHSAVDYEKYQTLHVVFTAPNFTSSDNKWYQAFQRKFIRTHGRISSASPYTNYVKIGYDFMLFVGNALKKHGVYFQEELKNEKLAPGFLSVGYDYQQGNDNRYVPFVYFHNGTLVLANQPQFHNKKR